MLDKAQPREMMPASANAGREKRKDIGTAGPSAEITNKSKAAWIPMRLAPFYFTRNGRVCSAEKWAEDVVRVMRHYAGLPDVLPKGWELPNGMECLEAPKEWKVLIRAGGITTSVSPEWFIIHAGNRLDYTSWIISCCATDIVTGLFDAKPRAPKSYCQSEWLPSDEESLKWHAGVLGYLFSYWRQNLERALKSGAAHVMARKNSVFAPFERITW